VVLGAATKSRNNRRIEELRANRKPIVDQCKQFGENEGSCKRIEDNLCEAYYDPSKLWRLGPCPLASHVHIIVGQEDQGKVRAGQQKGRRKRKNR
jgi:hypothetical protein